MDTVKRELGSDAVILSSRATRRKGFKNLFKKRVLEVMVAYDPEKAPLSRRVAQGGIAPQPEVPEDTASVLPPDEMRLRRIDERIDSLDGVIAGLVSRFAALGKAPDRAYSSDMEALIAKLAESQVADDLAHELASNAENIMSGQPEAAAREVLEQLIVEMIGSSEPIAHKKFKRKIVLALGPTGVGKTTSIVKLAANFVLKQKKKVGIINTDTYRIGANEQLKTYTDILSIPLGIVYQMEELTGALESMSDRDVIFIDTAGKRPGDEQHREDIREIIRIAEPEDLLVCVSATTSFSAMKEIIDTYNFVGDFKLVVTKLDETKHRGMLLNLRWYAQRHLSYITTGQSVPDDIALVDVESIASQLLT
jgi:flagellar biosynthesis protein FlhF